MTWFTLNPISVETRFERRPGDGWNDWRAPGGLGSAIAGSWSWASEHPTSTQPPRARRESRFTSATGARLHAPADVLQRMAEAADTLGRDESDIWVEAAREWLARHTPETTGGPANGAGRQQEPRRLASGVSARRSRLWRDIDGVLDSLRERAARDQARIPA